MKGYRGVERRKFIRLKSVFPVEFELVGLDGKAISDFQQGFTADVSKGGILLHANKINPELSDILERRVAKLLLNINIPLSGRPIEAVSTIAWIKTFKEGKRSSHLIGLSFEKIDKKDRERLVGYAASLYRTPRLATFALLLLLFSLGMNRVEGMSLRKENALLADRLSYVLQKRGAILEWLDEAGREKDVLLARLESEKVNIAKIETEKERLLKEDEELRVTIMDLEVLREELKESRNAQTTLESQLAKIVQDKTKLEEELGKITQREKMRLEELARIERARRRLEEATVENMHNWLKVHQNRRTGLIASYEGDPDLKDTAFMYDQSLVAQVFLLNGDVEGAKKILDFFKYKAKRHKGAFANAYGVNSGAITEHTIHCGPNIWLGIALMQYMDKTGDKRYLDLAKEIGDWVIKVQGEDRDGGIRGGPDISWFSTEHNLDAYAFFTMLTQKTAMDKYRVALRKNLDWIKNNAYSGSGRIYRGRGDSTIATDTFAWAIASIGPEGLVGAGMDPDAIMKFAEDNCKVTVDFRRPDGKVIKITGFDFARSRNMARGGVVSSEWTAQMVVSLRIMGDFYLGMGDYEKAETYQDKCAFYTNELEKLVIASPSPSGQGGGCFPYATQDNADTGHGWRTPQGEDTGSVSGTAYGIFAIKGYNPLKLESS